MFRSLINNTATLFLIIFFIVNYAYAQDTAAVEENDLPTKVDSAQVQTNKELQLKKFKKAFEKLVNTEKAEKKKAKDKVVTDPKLNLGGFVLDETMSRTGRTFYELFYQYWHAPENAHYYTITISEQPTPWRGTQIIITMNYERILSFRLQPRYHFIEKVSKQAVTYVHKKLKKQSSIEDQLIF